MTSKTKVSLIQGIFTILITSAILYPTTLWAQSVNIPKFTTPPKNTLNISPTPASGFPSTIEEYNQGASSLQTSSKKLYTTPWNMPQFDSRIEIQEDSSLNITETITADFSLDRSIHHGIYRYIPLNYTDRYGNNLNLRFELIKITDEKGNPYPYEKSFSDGKVRLKIGDEEKNFTEPKTYIINYKIQRAINYFEDTDELYWNVTGNDGKVDIIHSQTTIVFPKNFDINQLSLACYTGLGYSKSQNCQTKIISDSSQSAALAKKDLPDMPAVKFINNDVLTPGEGISIVVGFPKGIIAPPSLSQSLQWFLFDNWGYGIPLLTFLIFFIIWYKKGRDPRALKSTIMPEYEAPDKLSPGEIGTLIDQQADMNDITATIIDLAVRGYLIIHEEKKKVFFMDSVEYELEKTTPKNKKENNSSASETGLKEHERIIYEGIFGNKNKVNLNDLKNEFYKHIPTIQNKLYKELTQNGYFAGNPKQIRDFFYTIGMVIIFGTLFFLGPLVQNLSIYIGLMISGVIILAFGHFMPKCTQKGVDTRVKILGLEEFIKTAESDRVKFYEKENIFEKILPYAIALRVAEKWSKACEGLSKTQPNWYTSSDPNFMHQFNSYAFLHSINRLNSSMSTALASAPRSSAARGVSGFGSGGFSGGGFGGGGSGGW